MKIEQRQIRQNEIDVILATLKSAGVCHIDDNMIASIPSLNVVGKCKCGCASVDFTEAPFDKSDRIGDGVGDTPQGGKVGVLVWGRQGEITGLEIYDLGAGEGNLVLPVPGSIVPFEKAKIG